MKFGLRNGLIIFACLMLAGGIGFFLGRMTAAPGESGETVDDWLEPAAVAEDAGERLKQKNLELLGQVMLLKKMLGEVEGQVVLLGPVGEHGIARGRLVWDPVRMEGFVHAVQLPDGGARWSLEILDGDELLTRCPLPAPGDSRQIQAVFRPEKKILSWDRFQLVRTNATNQTEVILAGIRP